jgi:hypothetical protein
MFIEGLMGLPVFAHGLSGPLPHEPNGWISFRLYSGSLYHWPSCRTTTEKEKFRFFSAWQLEMPSYFLRVFLGLRNRSAGLRLACWDFPVRCRRSLWNYWQLAESLHLSQLP